MVPELPYETYLLMQYLLNSPVGAIYLFALCVHDMRVTDTSTNPTRAIPCMEQRQKNYYQVKNTEEKMPHEIWLHKHTHTRLTL